jgi:hypothetical protein
VSFLTWVGGSHGRSDPYFHNCSMKSWWSKSVVVASLVPTATMGREHGCTTAAAMAGTTTVGIVGDCPNNDVEDDTAIL